MCFDIIQVDNNISLKAVVFVGIYACIKCYGATSQLTRGGRQLGAGSPCEFVRGRLGRAGTLRLSSVRQSCELVATGAGTRRPCTATTAATHQTWLYVQAEAEQLVMHLFLCLQRHAHMEGKRQDTPKLLAPTLFASRARSAYSAPTHRWNAWHKVGGAKRAFVSRGKQQIKLYYPKAASKEHVAKTLTLYCRAITFCEHAANINTKYKRMTSWYRFCS